ncbi:TlpA disulfide reductase family protein [Bradyrhizobium yuanmingense]|uniref:TlpA family protein disulfide reductase n=1 Tax=Bradyrhizobium yuanmingense TaxID=108015 RepID=UPI0023B99E56|nr:TlpA disulfide reductase family protein [Bradyrhizobium yuanmingense]MDF0520831.1 TlpA disulfide reductase family protein [Bradyrhizobium yuanmingense]
MRETAHESGLMLSRRSILMAAPALLGVLRTARAQDSWPPVFEAGRNQFTLVRPHAPMPQLRLQDVSGRDAVVAPKPGRITLVNFWATWCAACKLDLPMLARLAGSRPAKLDIVAICTDTKDLRKVRAFLGGLAVPNLACYVDAYGTTAQASTETFSILGMPITYLVGTSGRIEGYIMGAPDWLSPAGAQLLQFYREQT